MTDRLREKLGYLNSELDDIRCQRSLSPNMPQRSDACSSPTPIKNEPTTTSQGTDTAEQTCPSTAKPFDSRPDIAAWPAPPPAARVLSKPNNGKLGNEKSTLTYRSTGTSPIPESQLARTATPEETKLMNLLRSATNSPHRGGREVELRRKIQNLEETVAEYERQKFNVMGTFSEYREYIAERERTLEAEYSNKIIALSEDVLGAKKDFETRMKSFQALQEQFEHEKEQALENLRQEHQKEIENLVQMSDQPGPSSGRRSDQDPPDLSDESDSEFEESSSGSSTSGSENDYEEGGDVFTYEITDKAAKFISKYFGSEVDYKLTPSSDGNFTCELTTTPDNRELHTSVLSGLDLALNLWPFGYLLQTLASETEDAFQTLFLDNTEKLVIIIEFCKLFNNHASSTWQEILDDKDKLMCMELNIRNILEYDDYTELGLATFVAELRTHFEEQESWKRAAEVLAEKQLDRLIPFLMGSRLSQKSADVLNLRLVSKTFQQKVDVVLKDNIFVQSLCRKKTLGIIEIDETRIETIPYSKTANPILHCDKTTLKKLLPFVSLPNNGDFSFAYQSETAKKLVESLNLTEKSEVEIAGKKYNLAQGTLSHGSLTEVVDQFIGNDSANNNLKRENADIVDEIPAKTQRSE